MEPGWIDISAADVREGELRGFEVGERLVLLACHRGAVTAMDDSCNHAGCLLSGGWIEAKTSTVVCPCHEYKFQLATGRNVTFPRLCGDQRVFPVRIEGGRIYIHLEE